VSATPATSATPAVTPPATMIVFFAPLGGSSLCGTPGGATLSAPVAVPAGALAASVNLTASAPVLGYFDPRWATLKTGPG
jgi:hypothetical protein